MYADRVEVRSPGGLMPGITVDDLLQLRVTSIPRNPVLAGFLRDVPGYMERIGSGIRFMLSEMRALGLPDPEFIEHQDFTVTFRNGTPQSASTGLNERQQLGLRIVRERGSISTGEYGSATSVAERTALRDLQDLVAKGLLVSRGKKRAAATSCHSTTTHYRHEFPPHMADLDGGMRDQIARRCQTCMPAPAGVNVGVKSNLASNLEEQTKGRNASKKLNSSGFERGAGGGIRTPNPW